MLDVIHKLSCSDTHTILHRISLVHLLDTVILWAFLWRFLWTAIAVESINVHIVHEMSNNSVEMYLWTFVCVSLKLICDLTMAHQTPYTQTKLAILANLPVLLLLLPPNS